MGRLTVLVFTTSCLFCDLGMAQPRPRITQRVDSTRTTLLNRTTHPAARIGRDVGRTQPDLAMDRVLLELQGSPEQEAALEQLIADQHDPTSPRYQRWLTPEQFGEMFGPTQQDVDTVTQWLESFGMTVNGLARGRRFIEFSGTASQMERTFHTELHHYDLDGETHLANATELAIPSALAPVVRGVASMHNFRHKPMHQVLGTPLTALTNGSQAISPYDFATIYNVKTLWNNGFDGTGQSVAIAGRTNIKMSDVTAFRSTFGLPANNTSIILNGADPGIVDANEETEADLDVQWSGAVAKGAAIKFVVSKSTNASDGIDLSSQYIVTNNLATAVSVSFGACEQALGGGNSFYNSLWQQAAAQGMSVFVSSGDAGSAGCDNPNSTLPATNGFGVNGLGSTPYNTAVGGTQFNEGNNTSAYWNTTNDGNKLSARSYIPEVTWNESSYTSGSGGNNLFAGSGGVSQLYATPVWQTGSGVPAGDPGNTSQHHRYIPDVSLTAAGHDGYLMYREGWLYMVGGTSASSPAFAGLAAILAQYTGGRNGNLNTRFYSLAAQVPSAYHDVTGGTIAVPCAGGTSACSTTVNGAVGVMNGYSAGVGYDLATGLGSVDAYAMALNWGSHPANTPSIGSLSLNPMTASVSAQTLTINGSNFLTGATVQATYAGGPVTSLPVTSLTATRITANITTGNGTRAWSITVTNPGGVSSFPANLQVNAPNPSPVITSLSPNPMTTSTSSQVLIINGSSFQSGAGLTVKLTYPGGPTTTLTGGQIAFVSSAQVLALVNVGTAGRTWSVTVTNPSGMVSNAANLTVVAPPPPPAIASLSPNPMTHANSAQTLTITGTGFTPGTGLRVLATYPGFSVLLQGSQITSASSTAITAQINVGNTPRNWTIQVINPNGDTSNKATLQVQ
jgi:pseudomonalisin